MKRIVSTVLAVVLLVSSLLCVDVSAATAKLKFPLAGSITTSSTVKTNGYNCDYKTGGSVAVYAPADGTVTFKQAYNPKTNKLCSYGNYFEFVSSDGIYKVKCCHLSSFVGVGTSIKESLSYPCSASQYQTSTKILNARPISVKQGDLLGYTGTTGNAKGHHLHLEVYQNGRAVNPKDVFTSWSQKGTAPLQPIVQSVKSTSPHAKVLFDAEYYRIKYDDLNRAFGNNEQALYNHWLTYGKREGRSPSPFYDADYYKNSYEDLRKAFGNNYAAYYDHWVSHGIKEFRRSSPIYEGAFYKNSYIDLQRAFGNDGGAYINHFYTYGMNEGRQANWTFHLGVYKKQADLVRAFGNNNRAYYYHYMEYGVREGRRAS